MMVLYFDIIVSLFIICIYFIVYSRINYHQRNEMVVSVFGMEDYYMRE